MRELLTDADLAAIARKTPNASPVHDLIAEVRRLREQLSEREACSHGIVTECRECGLAAFSWEFDRLRSRGAQLGDGR